MSTIDKPALVAVNIPWAGLGNRLRFTLSAESVADAMGRRFSYTWPVGEDFSADMRDLWDYSAEQLSSEDVAVAFTEQDSLLDFNDQPILAVRSASVLRGDGTEVPWETKFRSLRLRSPLRRSVEECLKENLGGDFVGVQVRASKKTHAKTLEASPVEWFIERMNDFRAESTGLRFYLSCDEPNAQEAIVSRIPNVFALPLTAEYNSKAALEKSVVDLYLLSRSSYLLGPHWSSFVYLARALSNSSQILETSRQVFAAHSVMKS